MLDSGPGTVANLQHHIDLGDLSAVVLSHVHPDHWSDFGVLRTAMKYGLGLEGLQVYGTAETREVALHLVGHELEPTVEWTVVADGDRIEVGGLSVRFSATDHYVETLAARVDLGGRSLAYSADTGPDWSFLALGDDLDVALCEATLLDRAGNPDVLHLTAREAGELARRAGVRRLLLTHLQPGGDPDAYRREAEDAFGAQVEIVEAGHRYEL